MLNKVKTNLGNQIRTLRKKQAITQCRLAQMCGVSQSYLSRLEQGKKNPSFDLLVKVAFALDVSVAELFAPLTEKPTDK